MQDLILSLAGDRSIILSTHILDEAERVCNRAVILSGGRIRVDSTPEELMARSTTGRLDDVFREITRGVAA